MGDLVSLTPGSNAQEAGSGPHRIPIGQKPELRNSLQQLPQRPPRRTFAPSLDSIGPDRTSNSSSTRDSSFSARDSGYSDRYSAVADDFHLHGARLPR